MNEEKELNDMKQESKKLREAYRKVFDSIREEFIKMNTDIANLNKRFYEISIKMDSILNFIDNFTN